MRWESLNLNEKSELMKLYLKNGITSLSAMKEHYNSYATGGNLDNPPDKDPVLKDRKPKANFYKRLLDKNRQTIPAWENRIFGGDNIATHRMSWATDANGNAIVYPEVQEVNGKLYDFTDPRNRESKSAAINRAIETGDTIMMTPAQANFWTQHYKEFYPSFATGGQIDGPDDPPKKPLFKQSQEQYYDPKKDIIYAKDTIGEGYQHEYFHARPDTVLLNNLKPYYENLNDSRLMELGADMPFVMRMNNDPNHFYSPEEIGARVTAAKYMLNKTGVSKIDTNFLNEARKNELQYGDNFRDLLHMYNNENLIKILNNSFAEGGQMNIVGNNLNFPQMTLDTPMSLMITPPPSEVVALDWNYMTNKNANGYKDMQDIWNYMINKGVSERNAAALMGNIMQESSFDPNKVQKGGDKAIGYFQMHGDKLKSYNNWLKANKKTHSNYTQVDYILDLLAGNVEDSYMKEYNRINDTINNLEAKKTLAKWEQKQLQEYKQEYNKRYAKRVKEGRLYPYSQMIEMFNNPDLSIEEVTDIFTNSYERAGRPEYKQRQQYAKDIYERFRTKKKTKSKK